MRCHEYLTAYDLCDGKGNVRQWYDKFTQTFGRSEEARSVLAAQVDAECNWIEERRPYYTVYPVAAESLSAVKLDLPCESIKMPASGLLVRFGVGHEPDIRGKKLKSILMGQLPINWADGEFSHYPGLTTWMDFDDKEPELGIPIYNYLQFPLVPNTSVEEIITQIPHSDPEEDFRTKQALRYALGVCLLADDPTVIKPDVLSKDRLKYERNPSQEIVDRAHRRGKIGWLVGADWETMPHYRRPHFALRWTGPGRTVPKIVPVKGTVVHRTKLSDVPEGYLGATSQPERQDYVTDRNPQDSVQQDRS